MSVSPGAAVAGAALPRPVPPPPRLTCVEENTVRQIKSKLIQENRPFTRPRDRPFFRRARGCRRNYARASPSLRGADTPAILILIDAGLSSRWSRGTLGHFVASAEAKGAKFL